MMPTFDLEMSLSRDFKLGEFLVSASHPEAMRTIVLRDDEVLRLFWLCQFGLQPIRDKWGPLLITSGFRTVYLNALVGGVPPTDAKPTGSLHCWGAAADFVPKKAPAQDVYNWIVEEGWKGEVILTRSENKIHMSLPWPGVKSDQFIEETKPRAHA